MILRTKDGRYDLPRRVERWVFSKVSFGG